MLCVLNQDCTKYICSSCSFIGTECKSLIACNENAKAAYTQIYKEKLIEHESK